MRKKAQFEHGPRQAESMPQDNISAAAHTGDAQQTVCVYGIPLNVNLPRPGTLCPWLNKSRKFYYTTHEGRTAVCISGFKCVAKKVGGT